MFHAMLPLANVLSFVQLIVLEKIPDFMWVYQESKHQDILMLKFQYFILMFCVVLSTYL